MGEAVVEGTGLPVDEVLMVAPSTIPKTSSGKLQRAKTKELFESDALTSRGSIRDTDRAEVVKEVVKSQIGYFKHALGGIVGKKE